MVGNAVQASLEDLMETHPSLSDAFLNRLFGLLNWTLTEFTISSQVLPLLPIFADRILSEYLFSCHISA